jgi:hypothetical protein
MSRDPGAPEPRRPMSLLQLMVTRGCALRCPYCQLEKRSEATTPEIMRGAVDLLFGTRSQEVCLVFFGGEPLERPDLVAQAIALAEARAADSGKRLRYALASNGLHLDPQTLGLFPAGRLQVFLNATSGVRVIGRCSTLLADAGVWHCVNVVADPRDLGAWRASVDALARAGVPRIEIFFRAGLPWPEETAMLFLGQVESLLREGSGPEIINAAEPIAPFLLHNDLVADCDGTLSWSAAIYLEQGFARLADVCRVGHVGASPPIDELWRSPGELRALLLAAYGPLTPEGRTLRNNLDLGARLCRVCGHGDASWEGALDEAPSPEPQPGRPGLPSGSAQRPR